MVLLNLIAPIFTPTLVDLKIIWLSHFPPPPPVPRALVPSTVMHIQLELTVIDGQSRSIGGRPCCEWYCQTLQRSSAVYSNARPAGWTCITVHWLTSVELTVFDSQWTPSQTINMTLQTKKHIWLHKQVWKYVTLSFLKFSSRFLYCVSKFLPCSCPECPDCRSWSPDGQVLPKYWIHYKVCFSSLPD